MTYYRREYHPVDGQADAPDRIWQEFQRIRAALMGIDQNNVLANGVDRETITAPNDLKHEGCSDVIDATAGAATMAISAVSGTVTLSKTADNGIWRPDTAMDIEVVARSESFWLVGFSAEFSWSAPTANVHAIPEVQISSSTAGVARGISSGFLGHEGTPGATGLGGACAIGQVSVLRLPAGRYIFRPNYRARWGTSTPNITYKDRHMFAVGFYQT